MRRCVLGLVAVLAWAPSAGGAMQVSGIVAAGTALPPAGAAYHGAGVHTFLGGQATLVCSSHGEFTSSVEPPATEGAAATADYSATFVGQLSLSPPLVPETATYSIEERARMVERIALVGQRGSRRIFETELQTFDLRGPDLPAGVVVREGPVRRSMGRTTITTLSRGKYRIESSIDVWLEISLDAGRTWHPAAAAVGMQLAPGGGRRTGRASVDQE